MFGLVALRVRFSFGVDNMFAGSQPGFLTATLSFRPQCPNPWTGHPSRGGGIVVVSDSVVRNPGWLGVGDPAPGDDDARPENQGDDPCQLC